MKTRLVIGLFSLLSANLIAGEFLNLDFERSRSDLPYMDPLGFRRVVLGEALPGWSVYVGEARENLVGLNLLPSNLATSDLIDNRTVGGFSGSVDGDYTLGLYSGKLIGGPFDSPIFSVSARQLGRVPNDAKSFIFSAANARDLNTVELNGVSVAYTRLGGVARDPHSEIGIYGVDVSKFGGEEIEIGFTVGSAETPFGVVFLDSMYFSPLQIPEPECVALLLVGGIFVALRLVCSKS